MRHDLVRPPVLMGGVSPVRQRASAYKFVKAGRGRPRGLGNRRSCVKARPMRDCAQLEKDCVRYKADDVQLREAHVTRTGLALAAALFGMAACLSSTAQACVSCEYVPEVAQKAAEKPSQKRTPAIAKERASRPQKRIAKKPPPVKAVPAQEEASKTAPAETPPENQTSTASTAALAETGRTAPAAETKTPEATAGAGECKKFSATAGTTITVPCK